jgi:S-adenosyl methyltransferase
VRGPEEDERVDAGRVPLVPVLDAVRIARLRDALADGHFAYRADRELAAQILERWPGTAALVKGANGFHGRAAAWAVSGGTPEYRVTPAAGVIFAASGYPLPDGFHADAQAAAPAALFAYADADAEAAQLSRALLAGSDPGRVCAYEASAGDPAGLLGTPEAKAILGRGPVMVQLQLCAQWWPSRFCAWAVAEYARLLSPGSTLALSLIIPGGGDGAAGFTADVGRAAGRIYPRGEAEVARWVKAAGMKLAPPGVADVRGHDLGWAAAEFGRQRPVARVVGAVAVIP